MKGPSTDKERQEAYEGAMMYLAIVCSQICRGNPGVVMRAMQRMTEMERSGLSPFMTEMGRRGAFWMHEEVSRTQD